MANAPVVTHKDSAAETAALNARVAELEAEKASLKRQMAEANVAAKKDDDGPKITNLWGNPNVPAKFKGRKVYRVEKDSFYHEKYLVAGEFIMLEDDEPSTTWTEVKVKDVPPELIAVVRPLKREVNPIDEEIAKADAHDAKAKRASDTDI